MWSTSLSMDTSGTHLQTQKCMQNTSCEWTGVPDQRKRIYRPFQTQDQALSPWSGSTDSKTLDYQRTNPREYQTVRTQKKSLEYKTWHHPTTISTLCRTPHLNNKQNKNTNPIKQIGLPPHSALPSRGKINKNSQISPYRKLTQTTAPTLEGQKPKGRKNSTLKPGKRRPKKQ